MCDLFFSSLVQWLKHSRKEYCELCKHRFAFTPSKLWMDCGLECHFFSQYKKSISYVSTIDIIGKERCIVIILAKHLYKTSIGQMFCQSSRCQCFCIFHVISSAIKFRLFIWLTFSLSLSLSLSLPLPPALPLSPQSTPRTCLPGCPCRTSVPGC